MSSDVKTIASGKDNSLKSFPKARLTYKVCLDFVKQDSWNFQFVPERFLTEEICLEAVKSRGYLLRYIPKEHLTYEICLEAVDQYDWGLRYVPKEFLLIKYDQEDPGTIIFRKLLSKEEIFKRFTYEELLTSDKVYLRKLGLEYE